MYYPEQSQHFSRNYPHHFSFRYSLEPLLYNVVENGEAADGKERLSTLANKHRFTLSSTLSIIIGAAAGIGMYLETGSLVSLGGGLYFTVGSFILPVDKLAALPAKVQFLLVAVYFIAGTLLLAYPILNPLSLKVLMAMILPLVLSVSAAVIYKICS